MPLFGTYLIFCIFMRSITSAFELITLSHLVSSNFTILIEDVTHAGFPLLLTTTTYVAVLHGHHLNGGNVPIHTAAALLLHT